MLQYTHHHVMHYPTTHNPPMLVPLPSMLRQIGGTGIAAAWAGGLDGREVIDRLVPHIPHLLAPRGRFYLVVLDANMLTGTPRMTTSPRPSLTDAGDIDTCLPGFDCAHVLSRRAGFESLRVLRFTRRT